MGTLWEVRALRGKTNTLCSMIRKLPVPVRLTLWIWAYGHLARKGQLW